MSPQARYIPLFSSSWLGLVGWREDKEKIQKKRSRGDLLAVCSSMNHMRRLVREAVVGSTLPGFKVVLWAAGLLVFMYLRNWSETPGQREVLLDHL